MKISAIAICILSSYVSCASAKLIHIINRDIKHESERKNPDDLFRKIHVPHSSASAASPFAASETDNKYEVDKAHPAIPISPLLPFLDEGGGGGGKIRLFGLDPNEPLTKGEAAFLNEAIRDSFHKIRKDHGIDLAVNNLVAVDNEVSPAVAFDLQHSNGRGSSSTAKNHLRGNHLKLSFDKDARNGVRDEERGLVHSQLYSLMKF